MPQTRGAGSLGNNIIKYQERAKENRRNCFVVFLLPCIDRRLLCELVWSWPQGAALSQHCVRPDRDASGETKHELDVSRGTYTLCSSSHFKSYNK